MSHSKLVIYNPTSGGGRGKKIALQFEQFLREQQIVFELYPTTQKKNACNLIREVLDPFKHSDLIVIGGDGTINEAVNGLLHPNIPMSVIPAGTGNDFVKMLSLGSSLHEQFEVAVNGEIKAADAGKCNYRLFLNGVGIGFDGQIVAAMQQKKKFLSGHAAYYYEVLRILSTYKEKRFQYQVDENRLDRSLILLTVGNGSTFGGGFKLTPKADIFDGLLDVCEIGNVSPLRRFLNILRLQKGTHDQMKDVQFYRAKTVEILANPLLNAHVDGEFFGSPPFRIEILPGFLKIRASRVSSSEI